MMRLLKSEFINRIFLALFGVMFMHAFEYGVLVTCGDGIVRRLFPRIVMYSADYPEKCVLMRAQWLSAHTCLDAYLPACVIYLNILAPAALSTKRTSGSSA